MTTGDKIRISREKQGLTLEYVAKSIGVATQTIFKYENNIVTNIPLSKIEKLSLVLNVSPEYLLGWRKSSEPLPPYSNIFPLKTKKIPLLGQIACGQPIYADEMHGEYVSTSEDINADFCLTCKGDSMINARIYDGDIVFIRKQESVNNGEIAAVIIDDEATLKRVYYHKEKNFLVLKAENPLYDDLIYTNEELDSIHILGKAIAFQSVVR